MVGGKLDLVRERRGFVNSTQYRSLQPRDVQTRELLPVPSSSEPHRRRQNECGRMDVWFRARNGEVHPPCRGCARTCQPTALSTNRGRWPAQCPPTYQGR